MLYLNMVLIVSGSKLTSHLRSPYDRPWKMLIYRVVWKKRMYSIAKPASLGNDIL